MRTTDPETGYIGETWTGYDHGPNVRCVRCGGRGMWQPRDNEPPVKVDQILCLRCAEDWHVAAPHLYKKHGFKDFRNRGRWEAAYNEFLQTKPVEVDIKAHNRRIEARDKVIHALFPEYFPESIQRR